MALRAVLSVLSLAVLLDFAGLPAWEAALAASAVVTAALGFLDQLRWLGDRVLDLFLREAELDSDLAGILCGYLADVGARHRTRSPTYGYENHFVRPLHRVARVVYEKLVAGASTWFWVKQPGRPTLPLRVCQQRDEDGERRPVVRVRFARGLDLERLLASCAEYGARSTAERRFAVVAHHGSVGEPTAGSKRAKNNAENSDNGTTVVPVGWRPLNYQAEDVGDPVASAQDFLALGPEARRLLGDAKKWLAMRQWYQDRRVPHHRGYTVSGPPGSGKTTLAREIAAELDLPIHEVDLATHTNQDLDRTWRKISAHTPCVVLMEDVDGVFRGRKPAHDGIRLTFDALLKSVDGAARHDGVLLFLTSNHPEHLDPALVRPGRAGDLRVEVGPLDVDGRLELVEKFFGRGDAEAEELARASGDVPARVFVGDCLALAERRMWGQP